MSIHTFKRTAKWWNDWAAQSVKFVRQYLYDKQDDLDEPFLRSCYILLSYALELMVKSRLVAVSNITEAELKSNYLHNIGKIINKLKSLGELEQIGIKAVQEDKTEHIYIVETTQGEKFIIHDFIDIRYNPKFKKNRWDEYGVIYETTKIMLGISEKIRGRR